MLEDVRAEAHERLLQVQYRAMDLKVRAGGAQARSQLPYVITPKSSGSKPPLQGPFPRSEPVLCNCLTSPFPSSGLSGFRMGLADVPGLSNL